MIAPKRVSSGVYLDLGDLSSADIDIKDINNSLNYLYRFTGHFRDKEPLTVAQHTVLCMDIASEVFPGEEDVRFDCLLHDMPEAYYGDLATPLKTLFGKGYYAYAKRLDDVVYEALWKIEQPFTKEVYEKRKFCDLVSLDIERRTMWKDQRGKDLWPDIPDIGMSLKDKFQKFEDIASQRVYDLEEAYYTF